MKTECHTHTYLTKAEEESLARLILKEIYTPTDRGGRQEPLPAPQGLCDLIF